MIHLRHRWEVIEAIGRVVTQRCRVCDRTRVRVRRPMNAVHAELGRRAR